MTIFAKTLIDAPKIKIPKIEGDFVSIEIKLFLLSNPLEECFPIDLLDRMRSIGLRPWKLRFFIWKPNIFSPWHVDTASKMGKLKSSINWVVKGSGEIQWNENLNLTPDRSVREQFDEGSIESSDSDEITHSSDGHGCLVNTSIPHRVKVGPEGRTTISLLWEQPEDFSFDETYKKLNSINLIKENI